MTATDGHTHAPFRFEGLMHTQWPSAGRGVSFRLTPLLMTEKMT